MVTILQVTSSGAKRLNQAGLVPPQTSGTTTSLTPSEGGGMDSSGGGLNQSQGVRGQKVLNQKSQTSPVTFISRA